MMAQECVCVCVCVCVYVHTFNFILYVWVYFLHECLYPMHKIPENIRRWHWTPYE